MSCRGVCSSSSKQLLTPLERGRRSISRSSYRQTAAVSASSFSLQDHFTDIHTPTRSTLSPIHTQHNQEPKPRPHTFSSDFFTSRKAALAWTRSHHYTRLLSQLAQEPYIPSAVWSAYTGLKEAMLDIKLPLNIHQQVLRKCAPSAPGLKNRTPHALYVNHNYPLKQPHPFERRFQIVIQNIQEAGFVPDIEDYNYILEHFAAVGHHIGAMRLFNEIKQSTCVPNARTFDSCLQALARRTQINIRVNAQQEVAEMCRTLLADMEHLHIHYSGPMLDAILVILRSLNDRASIERMLMLGYGIDIRNPDCRVEEFENRQSAISIEAASMGVRPPDRPSVSTQALNAVVSALGEAGDISGMVAAFEVLTTPIHTHLQADSVPFWPDISSRSPLSGPTPEHPPRPARPNTKTYEHLIKYATTNHGLPFCRHYLLEAMNKDREMDGKLRMELSSGGSAPAWRIPIQATSVMLEHLERIARARHDPQLIKWLLEKARSMATWRAEGIQFYSSLSEDTLTARGMPSTNLGREWQPSTPINPASTIRYPFNKSLHLWILSQEHRRIKAIIQRLETVHTKERARYKRRLEEWIKRKSGTVENERKAHARSPTSSVRTTNV